MNRIWLAMFIAVLHGCAASPWDWQDASLQGRSNPEEDLAECRSYASSQYTPGIPAGDPFLDSYPLPPIAAEESPEAQFHRGGTWHPDREPFPYTNRNRASIHGVAVPYTGYPVELDYHPEYLDALVEKCMAVRGWVFRESKEGTR